MSEVKNKERRTKSILRAKKLLGRLGIKIDRNSLKMMIQMGGLEIKHGAVIDKDDEENQ